MLKILVIFDIYCVDLEHVFGAQKHLWYKPKFTTFEGIFVWILECLILGSMMLKNNADLKHLYNMMLI